MKKLFCIGLIGTMLLSGCAGGNASSQERAETKPAETSIAEIDMAEGEGLNAIVYNGTCYYGVAFYGSESYVPSDAKLLGKAADSSECLSISPFMSRHLCRQRNCRPTVLTRELTSMPYSGIAEM